ncbi:pyruvate kinase-like [Tribolium madens]|uniref:pyruvate kinase-like n=1 Tax=Tribolium madens TaxID=41895 RepID=UPI001CF73801|nr:pyruvate kinase-like [Tribolium madens]
MGETTIVQGVGKCPKLPWMVEFHTTADGKIFNNQLEAAFAPNLLEHLASLQEKSKVRRKRLTQFSVIIPPRISTEHIEEFLKAGMTVALIRIDYFTVEEIEETVAMIRNVVDKFGKKIGRIYPIAIGLDISEQEILTGKLLKPLKEIELQKGQTTKIVAKSEFANRVSKDYIYVNYENIADVVKPGDSVIIGDDNIRMSAIEVARDIINCIIEKAGLLTDNLSVKLPNVPVTLPKTKSHEKLTLIKEKCEIDIVFVGPGKIDMIKEVLGPSVLIIAKIEYASSVDFFETLVKKADGFIIDGEKLMVTSKERVFLVQKSVIANCNKLGKPVLASINCHSVTKSIVNDIANTVIDGIDGLLLPPDPDLIESVSLICKAAEGAVYQKQLFDDLVSLKPPPIEPIISISISAVEASFKSNAAAIILITTTGRSAKLISSFRPRCPVIALTRFGRIAKQLMIYKGVIPIFYVQNSGDTFKKNVEKMIQLGMTFGKINGYIRMGDAVVVVFGTRNNVGFKNCMEVVFASEYDTKPDEDDSY